MSDPLGYAAFACGVLGIYLLANKRVAGWWVRIGSGGLWGWYAFTIDSAPVMMNTIVASAMAAYGLWKWRRDGND